MRRKDQEITDRKEIESIIGRARIGRLGFCDGTIPYVVPVNFGYENNRIFVHSAPEGRKIDILRRNNNVCFQTEVDVEIVRGAAACDWSTRYYSVIAFGRAFLVEDHEEKVMALSVIMKSHSGESSHEFRASAVDRAAVIMIEIDSITAKQSGH